MQRIWLDEAERYLNLVVMESWKLNSKSDQFINKKYLMVWMKNKKINIMLIKTTWAKKKKRERERLDLVTESQNFSKEILAFIYVDRRKGIS